TELAELIPILQRQAAEGRADPELVTMVRDAATLLSGAPAAKRAALDQLERQAENPGPLAEYPPIYAWLIRYGRTDRALTILEHRTPQGRVPYEFLRLAPEFKSLAGNERFVRVVAVARAQFDDIIALLRDADARSELPPFLRRPLGDLLRTLGIGGNPTS